LDSTSVLVALGGNALLRHDQKQSSEIQLTNARIAASQVRKLLDLGYRLVVTHGNGPQVGDVLLKNELAKDVSPTMPLDVCGAETQGMLGYILQQSISNELRTYHSNIQPITLITQTLVDKNDIAFQNPSKPIGPFYSKVEAERLRRERNWIMLEDNGRGFRRVVPSPIPIEIVEWHVVRNLLNMGVLVIQSGGGGIPVIREENGDLRGVEAVIDKDLSAALLASKLNVETLLILTDVERVLINYLKSDEAPIDNMTISQSKKYMEEGQFGSGSMGPKIQAAMNFVTSGGKRAIIASLDSAVPAMRGHAGTVITA
jgi:carbamate kinase